MRVEVWVRANLIKHVDDQPERGRFLRVAEWDDPDARHPQEAAQRVWRVCSSGAMDLTPLEQEWASQWRARRNGYGFGIGDVVVAQGVSLRCEAQQFMPCDPPL